MNYNNLQDLQLDATCTNIGINEWNYYMKGKKRANKREINRLIKSQLPGLYNDLCLDFYNPYNYFKTDTHLIVTHSAIEYFIRYY